MAYRPRIGPPGVFRSLPKGVLMSIRAVKRIEQAQPTIEGAGVRLRRAFG